MSSLGNARSLHLGNSAMVSRSAAPAPCRKARTKPAILSRYSQRERVSSHRQIAEAPDDRQYASCWRKLVTPAEALPFLKSTATVEIEQLRASIQYEDRGLFIGSSSWEAQHRSVVCSSSHLHLLILPWP